MREHFRFGFAAEDYRELLKQELDGVIVSSRHDLHYEQARAALERGLHVMCEKPMALHAREAWEMVALARENWRILLVPYGWHYKGFIQAAKKILDGGEVGRIEYVHCHMASPAKEFFAGRGTVPEQWQPALSAPEPATWQEKTHGGGYGHGQITHCSALLLWLTGLRARNVTARMTAPNANVDLYDSAAVEFSGGAAGSVSGAATLPDGDPFQIRLDIFGDRGVLALDLEAGRERLQLRRHDGRHREVAVAKGEGAYSCEGPPNRFIELIRGVGENLSPGEMAARSVELIEAMYVSAQEKGRVVLIEQKQGATAK